MSHASITSSECASSWDSGTFPADFYLGDTESSACAVPYQYVVSNTVDYDQVDVDRIKRRNIERHLLLDSWPGPPGRPA